MKSLRLVRVDFDNTADSNAVSEVTVITFVEEENKTAFLKLKEWFECNTQPIRLYLGWDLKFYPQWKVYEEEVF